MSDQTPDSEAFQPQQMRPLSVEILNNILAARQKILEDTQGQQFEDSTELIRQEREKGGRS